MRPKLLSTMTLAVLVGFVVAAKEAHAWRRTEDPGNALSGPADHDAGLVLPGVVSSPATTTIQANVWNLTVPLNSYVTRGQILGDTVASTLPDQASEVDESRVSPDEAGFAVAQAQLDVSQAEADLEAASGSETDAEVQQVLTQADKRAAKQRLENAAQQLREGEMSIARYDRAILAVDSSVDAADATRYQAEADASAVSDALRRLQGARARLAEAERQRQFALAAAEDGPQSGRIAVVSPADGLLVVRDPVTGTLGISSDPSVLLVQTWIPEADLLKLRVGQPAWVSLDSEPQVRLRAKVSEIAQEPIESASGTIYPVAFSVDNPQGLFLAGLKVHVRTTGP